MTWWKNIKWEYYMNELGEVKNFKSGKFRKTYIDPDGYKTVKIGYKNERYGFQIHRRLGELFIPNTDDKPTVDHINQNKLDNSLYNLRWATYKEQANNRDNTSMYLNFPQHNL